jgi:hypothetical protein
LSLRIFIFQNFICSDNTQYNHIQKNQSPQTAYNYDGRQSKEVSLARKKLL